MKAVRVIFRKAIKSKRLARLLGCRSRAMATAFWALAIATVASLPACAVGRPKIETVLTGLSNPRGLAFDDLGRLHVAEAGTPEQPGRIVRVEAAGNLTEVASGFPLAQNPMANGEDVGVSGLAFAGSDLYTVTGQGLHDYSSFLFRIPAGGQSRPFARLWKRNRPDLPNQDSGTNPFDITIQPGTGAIFVSDAAGNQIFKLGRDGGEYEVYAQMADERGGPVPTGIAFGPDGRLYVTIFSTFPHDRGTGSLVAVGANGQVEQVLGGLTLPIDVAFDRAGAMYVLEFAAELERLPAQRFKPRSGRVLRIEQGIPTVVVDGLNYPVSITFGPDGYAYVVTGGAFEAAGKGGVVRFKPAR